MGKGKVQQDSSAVMPEAAYGKENNLRHYYTFAIFLSNNHGKMREDEVSQWPVMQHDKHLLPLDA